MVSMVKATSLAPIFYEMLTLIWVVTLNFVLTIEAFENLPCGTSMDMSRMGEVCFCNQARKSVWCRNIGRIPNFREEEVFGMTSLSVESKNLRTLELGDITPNVWQSLKEIYITNCYNFDCASLNNLPANITVHGDCEVVPNDETSEVLMDEPHSSPTSPTPSSRTLISNKQNLLTSILTRMQQVKVNNSVEITSTSQRNRKLSKGKSRQRERIFINGGGEFVTDDIEEAGYGVRFRVKGWLELVPNKRSELN